MQVQPAATTTPHLRRFNPWANQLGGILVAQYIYELDRRPETPTKPEPEHLFQKTKGIFLNGGLDELEHLLFRETKLRKLCLQKAWEMTRKLNPSHPRFQPEPDPDTENYDWREPPLIEPQISRERLEEEVASWYVRTIAKETYTDNKRMQSTAQIESIQIPTNTNTNTNTTFKAAESNNNQTPSGPKNRKTENQTIPYGPELNKNQLCKEIQAQLEQSGKLIISIESIEEAVEQAQQSASKKHRTKGIPLPIKLRKNKDHPLLLDRYAMTAIGERGRGKSSKYKKIKI